MGVLAKLAGRSPTELWVRARQLAYAVAEERLGPDRLASGARVQWRTAPWSRGLDLDLDATATLIRTRYPDEVAALLARAERAVLGRFDLLGYRDVSFGMPIDWQWDPFRDRHAPAGHWRRIPFLDVDVVGDHKLVWELNRHAHFVTLAQAWRLTRDDRFAEALAGQLTAWLDANPAQLGVNWASSLEVAFRAIAWSWAHRFANGASALGGALGARWATALGRHAEHVERYLSTYFSPNTHLTGEALGILTVGCALEGPDAERWRASGRAILVGELGRQLRPDGVYFEQTTWYHRYTVDFLLHTILLAGEGPGAERLRARTGAALDHLAQLVRPDGSMPHIGDDDGGMLLNLEARPTTDVRPTLALAAALLGRADCRALAGGTTASAAWLLGAPGLAGIARAPIVTLARRSQAFTDSGYYVLREGEGEDGVQLTVDAGPHGALSCGHAHADALAVTLAVGSTPLLVDPGTFTYVGPERDLFRATAAHNTMTLDGVSSSDPDGMFRWRSVAGSRVRTWRAGDDLDVWEGEHDGYQRLAAPATHRRFVLRAGDGLWIILDVIEGSGSHVAQLTWQLAAGLSAVPAGTDAWAIAAPSGRTRAYLSTSGKNGVTSNESSEVSAAYGVRDAASALRWRGTTQGWHATCTVVSVRESDGPPAVHDVASEPGAAQWTVATPSSTHRVTLCEHPTADAPPSRDLGAALTWRTARPDGSARTVVVRGSARAGDRLVQAADGMAAVLVEG